MELHKTLLEALNRVIEVQGTDLLLTVGTCPGVRLDAAVQPVDDLPVLDDDAMNEVLGDLLDATQAEALARDRDVDFAFSTVTNAFAATSSMNAASRRSRSA